MSAGQPSALSDMVKWLSGELASSKIRLNGLALGRPQTGFTPDGKGGRSKLGKSEEDIEALAATMCSKTDGRLINGVVFSSH